MTVNQPFVSLLEFINTLFPCRMIQTALDLHTRSPKAYGNLRQSGQLKLPHPKHLQKIKNFVNQKPGINPENFHWMLLEADRRKLSKRGRCVIKLSSNFFLLWLYNSYIFSCFLCSSLLGFLYKTNSKCSTAHQIGITQWRSSCGMQWFRSDKSLYCISHY